MSTPQNVSYLIFDIETVADGALVSKIRFPGQGLDPHAATAKYRAELLEQNGKDILPATFMLPACLVVAKVGPDFRLLDLVAIDEPNFRPYHIVRGFWQGWKHYSKPVLVTFNGRGYDLPVLEYAAYRYGLSLPEWFNIGAMSYEQSRNRYNVNSHLDLYDLFSNYGAFRPSGGLNLLANLIGKPGKSGIDGSQVQDYFDSGKIQEIVDYCRCDVLDTYFVFLRSRVMLGRISLEEEQRLVDEAKAWIEQRAENQPGLKHYLENWGDWQAPETEPRAAP
jgi:predicted PolB exonuclease-like 3'-5' exonuclease